MRVIIGTSLTDLGESLVIYLAHYAYNDLKYNKMFLK